jgi:hypothetical protein
MCVEIFMRQTLVRSRFTAAAIIFNETQPQFTSGRLLVHHAPHANEKSNLRRPHRNAAFWTCENWTKAVPTTQFTCDAFPFIIIATLEVRGPHSFSTLTGPNCHKKYSP